MSELTERRIEALGEKLVCEDKERYCLLGIITDSVPFKH